MPWAPRCSLIATPGLARPDDEDFGLFNRHVNLHSGGSPFGVAWTLLPHKKSSAAP